MPVSSGRHRGTVIFTATETPVLETSKLPNSAGDRRFESISLYQRVRCSHARIRSPCWRSTLFLPPLGRDKLAQAVVGAMQGARCARCRRRRNGGILRPAPVSRRAGRAAARPGIAPPMSTKRQRPGAHRIPWRACRSPSAGRRHDRHSSTTPPASRPSGARKCPCQVRSA